MHDTARRLYLRVTLKLLTLIALLAFGYVLFSGGERTAETPPPRAPLQVRLETVQPGQPQRLEWAGGPLQLLRMGGRLYLYQDRGGSLGCPLAWQPPGSTAAPRQPWPGGFRDQCNATWYLYDGSVLPDQGSRDNLQAVPYRLRGGNLLEVGLSGDNAAPATSPAN